MLKKSQAVPRKRNLPVATMMACSILLSTAFAQQSQGNGSTALSTTATSASNSRNHPPVPNKAREYYPLVWGVDSLGVRSMESGELIRFNYRVVDATRAQPLNDKKSEPFLIDQAAGVKLVVPSMEKVGQLRQSSTPEAGKVYWMAFSNKGGRVKRGDRVTVVIGNFHADGLVVE